MDKKWCTIVANWATIEVTFKIINLTNKTCNLEGKWAIVNFGNASSLLTIK